MQKSILSIVIVAVSGQQAIESCLRSLANQCAEDMTEVIVIGCAGDGVGTHLAQILPGVQVIELKKRQPVPYMRSLGWRRSQGDIIAFTEDHCIVQADWVAQLRQAHQLGDGAIGGSIRPDETGSLVDWAVYFCEYSPYLAPATGTVRQLPGNNVSYKRQALAACPDLWESGAWETVIHQRLQQRGIRLISAPDLIVYYRNRFRFAEFMRLRFYYGRCFAGNRFAKRPAWQRILPALGALLLPALLPLRMAGHARRHRRYLQYWSLALPWIIPFTVAWSLGEALGYLLGPGQSCEKV